MCKFYRVWIYFYNIITLKISTRIILKELSNKSFQKGYSSSSILLIRDIRFQTKNIVIQQLSKKIDTNEFKIVTLLFLVTEDIQLKLIYKLLEFSSVLIFNKF